ncbi:hypothetical protein GG344DRAFT_71201 [Lentinula edodes]|nr:hypothetical protein GG344DRAFT_71201 [Lentinula edodes]
MDRLATDPKRRGRTGERGGGEGEVGDSCSDRNRGTGGWEPAEGEDTWTIGASRDCSTFASPDDSGTGPIDDMGTGGSGTGSGSSVNWLSLGIAGTRSSHRPAPPRVVKEPLDAAKGPYVEVPMNTTRRLHIIQGQSDVVCHNVGILGFQSTTKEGNNRFNDRTNATGGRATKQVVVNNDREVKIRDQAVEGTRKVAEASRKRRWVRWISNQWGFDSDGMMYRTSKGVETSAMPVPVPLPSLLEPVMSSSTSLTPTPSTSNEHGIVLLPPLPHVNRTVSKEYLRTENMVMRTQLEAAGKLLSTNFAHMKRMEAKNKRLRNKAFTKKRKCVAVNTGVSRHLTAEENMKELLKEEMKCILTPLKPKFKELKKKIRELGRGRSRGHGRGHIQKGQGQGQTQAMANQSEDSSSETSSLNHTDHAPENDNPTDSDSDSEAALTSSVHTAPLKQAHSRPKPRPIPPSDSNTHSLHPVDAHESFDVPITGDPGTDNAKDPQTSFEEKDNGVSKEDEAIETAIQLILRHKWIGWGLKFMVEWVDNNVTWKFLSNIKDFVALDDYLVHHGLAEPSKLSKKRYLLSGK